MFAGTAVPNTATAPGTPTVAVAATYSPGVVNSFVNMGRQFPTPGTAAGLPSKAHTPILGIVLLLAVLLVLERRRLGLVRRRA